MTITIRPETTTDIDIIYTIEKAAFRRTDEAELVNRLRENKGILFSLVAEIEGTLVGHILFSQVTIENATETFKAVGLGPVAILPKYQKQGIGTALIEHGLHICHKNNHDVVFLVGHPTYYPRFGFQPAVPLGFDCIYVTAGQPNDHFMVKALRDGVLEGKSGYLRYRPEFDGI